MTRGVALAVGWLLCLAAAAAAVALSQSRAQDALLTRFDARADAAASFVEAYAEDVFERERRLASWVPRGRVSDAALTREAFEFGFSSAVLLDSRGRVLASAPIGAAPPSDGGGKPEYLVTALAGVPAVSDAEAVGPTSAHFALPLKGRRGGALSVGVDLRDGPLRSFLAAAPVQGTHGFLIDSTGVPLLAGGVGVTAELDEFEAAGIDQGPVHGGGRVAVAAPVGGTPWRLMLTVPETALVAPTQEGSAAAWWLLAGMAAVTLLCGLVLVWTDARRRRSHAAQEESEQRFRLTVDNAPIGITLVSLDGRFLHPNPQLQQMVGYSAEELQGLTFGDITHPEDLEADLALLDSLVKGEIPNYQMEKRYLRRDGEVVWAKLSVSLVRDAAGTPLHFVSQAEDVTQIRAVQEELQRRALYDPLTGLANRNLLLDRLTHLLVQRERDGGRVAVAFCDLDHFKRINDSLGHHAGDHLLREVARRLQDAVRGGDTVARMGGDEFVLLLSDVASEPDAAMVLDRVKAAVEAPIELSGQEFMVSFSAGLAVCDSGQSAEALLRDADTALYAAKEQGRSCWQLYTGAMRQRALMQLSVENELRRAIDGDDFELHYQPIVNLHTGEGVAYEALLRWRHPRRGLVLPGGFLDIAEESQLIVPLGRLVLRHACQFLARHRHETWRVFVNVSPVQIGRGLVHAVTTELEAVDIPPSRLGLEITENGVLDATGSSLREMQQLAQMGISLLMDDFGTGYSALTSVLAAPIAGIKLDRSFTARLGDGGTGDRITATVGDLVASLGAYGVVEGIETQDQRRRAVEHGWSFGQGYLLGRPAPEADLADMAPPTEGASSVGLPSQSVPNSSRAIPLKLGGRA